MEVWYVIIGAAIIGAIIFFSFYFSKQAVIKRKLRRTVLRKISHVRHGEVTKIVGKVEFIDPPLTAPLSGRPCAYYHVRVEQKVSSGKSSHWKTIIDEEIGNKFVIRDGDRYAIIKSDSLKSHIIIDRKYRSGFRNDATDILEKYLRDHGLKSEGLFGINKNIRYQEGILEEGEMVAVLGKGEWKDPYKLDLPESFDKILVMNPTNDGHLYLSDDPVTLNDIAQRR